MKTSAMAMPAMMLGRSLRDQHEHRIRRQHRTEAAVSNTRAGPSASASQAASGWTRN